MPDMYLIYCPYCCKSTTVGKAPKQVGYSKVVSCSVCNRKIDASKGKNNRVVPVRRIIPTTEQNMSLLSISD